MSFREDGRNHSNSNYQLPDGRVIFSGNVRDVIVTVHHENTHDTAWPLLGGGESTIPYAHPSLPPWLRSQGGTGRMDFFEVKLPNGVATWVIEAIAVTNPDVELVIRKGDDERTFGGPWMVEGFTLRAPFLVPPAIHAQFGLRRAVKPVTRAQPVTVILRGVLLLDVGRGG